MDAPVFLGLEAGGTKCVCLAASGPEHILAETVIPTTTPDETLGRAAAFFTSLGLAPAACGAASFGPLHVRRDDPAFGRIAKTPKPGWEGADVLSAFAAWDCPKAVHTDVVGAALAEQRWGAGRGEDALGYVTIGTGIGAGVLQGGRPVGGAWHLEFGHLRAQRLPGDDFPGVCPFHGDCFEGLASGPAIAARSGARLSDLPPDHPAHALEVGYLAQLCAALVFAHAPGRILLGGGVLLTPHLLERLRARLPDLLGGYAGYAQAQAPASFLQAPGLGGRAGALGAVALAMQAARL